MQRCIRTTQRNTSLTTIKLADETTAGHLCVKRLLAGDRGHYGPLEHAQIVLNASYFLTQSCSKPALTV